MVRGSDGTLYVVYTGSGTGFLTVAYSRDGGLTWAQDISGLTVSAPALAIDRTDKVHIIFYNNGTSNLKYVNYTISGGFSSPEVASPNTPNPAHFAIAVDSVDDVHIGFFGSPGAVYTVRYNKRTSGTWGTQTDVYNSGSNIPIQNIQIALDSNNYIYLIWIDNPNNAGGGFAAIKYAKFTSFWTGGISLTGVQVDSTGIPAIAVDSADNVHVVYARSGLGIPALLKYLKYTKMTDTWASVAAVSTTATTAYPTIAIDASDVLSVVFNTGGSALGGPDIYLIQNTGGVWGSETKIITATGSQNLIKAYIQSTVYPVSVNGRRTNIATTGYHFTDIDTDTGTNIIRYYASADFTAPNESYLISVHDSTTVVEGSGNGLIFAPTFVINVADTVHVTEGSVGNGGIVLALGVLTSGTIHVGATGALGCEVYEFFTGLTDNGNPINMNVEGNNMQIVTFNAIFEPRILQMEVKEGSNVQLFVAYDDGAFKPAGVAKRGYTKITLDVDPMTDAFPRCRLMKVAWREYSSNRCTISRMAVLGYEVPDEEDYRQ